MLLCVCGVGLIWRHKLEYVAMCVLSQADMTS
jgi:hypothetical protein